MIAMRAAVNQLSKGYSVALGIQPALSADREGAARVPDRKEGGMAHLVTVILAVLLGFLAGLLSFKVKSRWCPDCGTVKRCSQCAGRAAPGITQGFSASATKGWLQRIRNRQSAG